MWWTNPINYYGNFVESIHEEKPASDYIERIASHAVFLKIRPAYKLKGMKVFDSDGESIGIVVKVNLYEKKNELVSLVVKSPIKEIIVPSEMINNIGYNVLLKEKKDNFKHLYE